jgi:hypothetical protein
VNIRSYDAVADGSGSNEDQIHCGGHGGADVVRIAERMLNVD